ncbi:hypothetical protein WJX84_000797 [Apatococcus fuscideae]|uniref:Proteasome assembly chaperone 3 n=1 Tax=Apatococcus fuscideae TaxID=2026836 RepID=A0AAW1SL00_9CHLO
MALPNGPVPPAGQESAAAAYSDRIMLVATNTGTFGTIMQARLEMDMSGSGHPSIIVLLGRRDEPGLALCARRLVEAASAAGCTRPLLLCLGLQDHSLPVIRTVIQAFLDHPVW